MKYLFSILYFSLWNSFYKYLVLIHTYTHNARMHTHTHIHYTNFCIYFKFYNRSFKDSQIYNYSQKYYVLIITLIT